MTKIPKIPEAASKKIEEALQNARNNGAIPPKVPTPEEFLVSFGEYVKKNGVKSLVCVTLEQNGGVRLHYLNSSPMQTAGMFEIGKTMAIAQIMPKR